MLVGHRQLQGWPLFHRVWLHSAVESLRTQYLFPPKQHQLGKASHQPIACLAATARSDAGMSESFVTTPVCRTGWTRLRHLTLA